jgi:hypothetical protein
LEASEGRRKRRQRNTTPDAIGLGIKRALLERAVADDPAAESFEQWLMSYAEGHCGEEPSGAVAAMARTVFEEWQLAHFSDEFRTWLDRGAPSDDARLEKQNDRRSNEQE